MELLHRVATIEDLTRFVQMVGFPICMCIWFLFRIEKRLETMSAKFNQLALTIAVLVRTMDLTPAETAHLDTLLHGKKGIK